LKKWGIKIFIYMGYRMIVNVETNFKSNYDTVIEYVQLSKTLDYIAKPLLVFKPNNQNDYPEVWKNGKYLTSMKLFGIIPFGNQFIVIEKIKEGDPNEFILRDNGYGDVIKTWDHWIFIRKTKNENLVKYIDRIEVKAGVLTIFIAIFASLFYRWRQYRWKRLIHYRFQPLSKNL
jgi:hypothetical protein